MVKVFERYKHHSTLGLINSAEVLTMGNKVLSLALENIYEWDIKQATKNILCKFDKNTNCIAIHSNKIAVGLTDGSIHLITNGNSIVLNGHKQVVSCLAFDESGNRLVSGSADNNIILWDIVQEVGVKRFKGHKDRITQLQFLDDYLVSASKDSLIKVWDIEAGMCVENITIHRGEVWSCLVHNGLLYTGCQDTIRVFELDWEALKAKLQFESAPTTAEIKKAFTLLGTLKRQTNEAIKSMKIYTHNESTYLCVAAERMIETFTIKNQAEITKAIAKKKKKAAKKGIEFQELEISEKVTILAAQRCSAKIKSFDFYSASDDALKIVVGLGNNTIELYSLDIANKSFRLHSGIELPGHRSDIRTLALSSDDEYILSGSSDLLKIWSRRTGTCLNTFQCGYALCCTFLPGNKHIVVGTKEGTLDLYEISSGQLLESIEAHQGAVWSLCMLPDKTGFVTGSQDKDVKFWKFVMIDDREYSTINQRPSLVHTRTLKLSDDVLCVKVSPDSKLIAVSLLDLTVKVFFMDTLKFSLSLYGHKLPVISMDISSDSRIIITSSSDKSVKIWGLDFGDCHKSIFAHQDSVMQVQFVWGTYYFFSVSKDKTIKYWDAEKFEEISMLKGHHGEVWALAVGKYGNFIVTGSHDRSIRVWEKTDEQFVIQEEREERLEQMYQEMDIEQARIDDEIGGTDEVEDQVTGVLKTTGESLKAGELIAEAIRVWELEKQDWKKYEEIKKLNPQAAAPPRNGLVIQQGLTDCTPDEFVYKIIAKVRSSHLHDALLTLPFSLVVLLLDCVSCWVEKRLDPVLYTRILTFLLKTHHNEIISTTALKPVLEKIRQHARGGIKQDRDVIGYNLASLQFLKREQEMRKITVFGDDTPVEEAGGIKRKRVVVVS